MQRLRCCLQPVLRQQLSTKLTTGQRHCTTAGSTITDHHLDFNPLTQAAPRKRRNRQTAQPSAEITVADDVRSHFNTPELDAILRSFPAKLLRRKYRYPEHFYISNPRAAEHIAPLLFDNLPADRPLVEVNPGPGLLTQRLLDSGRVGDLRMYEWNREFIPSLVSRFVVADKQRSERITTSVRAGDMLNLYRMSYQDKLDKGRRVERFLAALPQRDWTDDVNMRLFACVGSVNFFKHLISSTVLQSELMAFGRPEMVLVMPPPLYIHLTCDSRAGLLLYRSTSMLFQIFFTHEFIARVPRTHFLPFQHKTTLAKYNRVAAALDLDRDYLYLVRVVPRRDLFDFVAPDQIQALWYFIKQNCISRSNCVIPNLEKLIPGAGAHLILDQSGPPEPVRPLNDRGPAADAPKASIPCTTMSRRDRFVNMNIFTTFGDLSPSQMLALFHQFTSWPGYEGSAFRQGMEESLQKMEMASAGIEDELAEGVVADGVEVEDEEDVVKPNMAAK